jgi:hypothetical protein
VKSDSIESVSRLLLSYSDIEIGDPRRFQYVHFEILAGAGGQSVEEYVSRSVDITGSITYISMFACQPTQNTSPLGIGKGG